MNKKLIYSIIGGIVALVAVVSGILLPRPVPSSGLINENLGAINSLGLPGYAGVYNSSTNALGDGQATALAVDNAGYLILSGSSSIKSSLTNAPLLTGNYFGGSTMGLDGIATPSSTSSTTITLSGFPFTVGEENGNFINFVMYKRTGTSVWTKLDNAMNGVSLNVAANIITINGAGNVIVGSDSIIVGLRGADKAYTAASNAMAIVEGNPLSLQVLEQSLVDTTNVASATAVYYPSSLGAANLGYSDFSLTGKLIDADNTSTLYIEVTNDEDTTNADFSSIYCNRNDTNTTVNSIQAVSSTVTFAITCDVFNYRYWRVKIQTGDNTNTVIIKNRLKAL